MAETLLEGSVTAWHRPRLPSHAPVPTPAALRKTGMTAAHNPEHGAPSGSHGQASSTNATASPLPPASHSTSLPGRGDDDDTHNGDEDRDEGWSRSPDGGKPDRRRPFLCRVAGCGKQFYQRAHLKIHERSHTGYRPYKCPFKDCDKSFTQLGNLKTHERKHTGERPYKCTSPDCGKAFSQLGNLRTHERTHLAVKPFFCNMDGCEKQFTQMGNLRTHQRKVHGVDPAPAAERSPGQGGRGRKPAVVDPPAPATPTRTTPAAAATAPNPPPTSSTPADPPPPAVNPSAQQTEILESLKDLLERRQQLGASTQPYAGLDYAALATTAGPAGSPPHPTYLYPAAPATHQSPPPPPPPPPYPHPYYEKKPAPAHPNYYYQ
ncbi:hypothetical protein IWQ60_004952 [Tieghemiomyces parasiticus]|uniref:C2H2-type domain-containing protein n=1 Tax=Tieghemiomyces parasiticus TaxID=78921 RepID=A0A9W8ACN0_9FUNG|nr:hypothetical protein IWQ60_004952 [Tieghemiomyces parasiticus]